ncbi:MULTISPECIES: helicase-associated domain-containing protein [unclassified Microbacterium]|uniref:helicase-associated domain-containing protein n=1 Tax=unclassified Microbacterium TaxID=2609290 RepID=UPI00386C7A68
MTASDARALANRLAQLDSDALARLFDSRQVAPQSTWSDFFDVAEALLDPAQTARAVATLSDLEAHALLTSTGGDAPVAEPVRTQLANRALIDDEGRAYEPLRAALAEASPRPSTPLFTGGGESDEASAERAFEAAASLADVLHSATKTPLARIGNGALSAADRRRLVEGGAVADAADADLLVAIADLAGLLAGGEKTWLVTDAGSAWLRTRTLERWHAVAVHLRERMPSALRTADGGWRAPGEWATAYPYDPTWAERAAHVAAIWTSWALVAPDGTSPSWGAGLARGGDADVEALRALLPHEVDRVYLQNDLTAIAPGPLEPHLDMRLRTMARRESRAQASTYRFTAETVGAAFASGETAASLTEFLTELSLTGVPQPLAYEIERSAARHGTLRVGPDGAGSTRVTGDRDLIEALAVDQALRSLGLILEGDALVTRSGPETVYWMLTDARYPVLAVGADGAPRALDRHQTPTVAGPAPTAADRYETLLGRLKTSLSGDADAAWLERELDHAVRTRSVVVIVVRMPDGSTREVTVEAAGLGGGRLRGRDRAADVERTLPLSSIVSVRPA